MSTTLPHGIIQINEGNIAWYGDITTNWQLIDSKIGEYDAAIASIPAPANNGTLTINYGDTTIAMFGADDAGDVSADIPAPGDGTLTIRLNGVDVQTFTANQANDVVADIIPPVPGDGTLTIKVNGATAGTFTANQSTAATANITVPTAVSELTNDSGYLTSSSNLDASKLASGTVDIARLPQGALERLIKVANEAARYALTTADVQLGDTVQQLDTGIMYVVTDTDHLDSAAGYTEYTAGTAASVPWSGVTGKPTFAAVATSGAYSDLTGTPTIPTVNNATLTIQKNGTNVQTFTANQSTNATANITVPTKTSELTNDSGFITSDNTKIPLAGSNQISGSLIPATDNSIDIGSSTNNIKMLYTKGITINGTQFLPSDYVPRSGGAVMTGTILAKTTDDSYIALCGSTDLNNGAYIRAYGKDYSDSSRAGTILIRAKDNSNVDFDLVLKADGTAMWGSKNLAMREDVIPRSGGAVLSGTRLSRTVSDGELRLDGGDGYAQGAMLSLSGKNRPDLNHAGVIFLYVDNGSANKTMFLYPDGTWTWNGTAVQITSDQRYKQQITEIDDKLLDAWEDVNLVQFKYNDAVKEKSDNARLHTGYVVQQIDNACKEHGVDVSAYGLFCHEEYPEETEEVEVEQKDGTKTKERKVIREASEHYSLRYTEVYAVECMYLRRCVERLTARIEQLTTRIEQLEKEQEASK